MDQGAELYRCFLQGDDAALTSLIALYRPPLTRYLMGLVHQQTVVEELVEDTFFILCCKKPEYRKKGTFKTWLFTIGRHQAIDLMRKQNRHGRIPLDACFTLPSAAPTPEEAFLRQAQTQTVAQAMKRLPAQYGQALYLYYYEGFSIEQLAEIFKKSKHNTSALLYRARLALKEALQKEGFVYGDE